MRHRLRVPVNPEGSWLEFFVEKILLFSRKRKKHEPFRHAHSFKDESEIDSAPSSGLSLFIVAFNVCQQFVFFNVLEHFADAFDNVVVDEADVCDLDAQGDENEQKSPSLEEFVGVRVVVVVAFEKPTRAVEIWVVAVGTRFGAGEKVLSVAAGLEICGFQKALADGQHGKGRKVENPAKKRHENVPPEKQRDGGEPTEQWTQFCNENDAWRCPSRMETVPVKWPEFRHGPVKKHKEHRRGE